MKGRANDMKVGKDYYGEGEGEGEGQLERYKRRNVGLICIVTYWHFEAVTKRQHPDRNAHIYAHFAQLDLSD